MTGAGGGGGRQVGKDVEAAGRDGPPEIKEGGFADARCSSIEVALEGEEPSGVLQLDVKTQIPASKAC